MKKKVKLLIVPILILGFTSCRDIPSEVANDYCACSDADDARQCVLDWAEKNKDLKLTTEEDEKLKSLISECKDKVEGKF